VLDAVLNDMKASGELAKSGRGLFDGDATARAEKAKRKRAT